MISQSEIHSRINQIWQIFTAAGVTDPLTIIENLAYFFLREELQMGELYGVSPNNSDLLEFQQVAHGRFMPTDLLPDLIKKFPDLKELPDIKQLVPQFTSSLGIDEYLKIGNAVHSLLQEVPSAAHIFNEVLPEFLEKIEPGGRYFTPRHLTRWAASLLEISSGASLADFACGSGGFLVAAAERLPQVTGVEISPNWARLAFANCLLHGIQKPDIRIGNSLSIFGKREKETKFDCVLMNPPFGVKVDDTLVSKAFDFILSGRSETVLTALALNRLSDSGRMIVFLPSGSLFANSGGEQILREGWIEKGELAAVVALPKDAFQPYSQAVTHALLIEKTQEPETINWFFQPRFDGFTSGRNRQPDPEHNDLPLITTAIRSRKEAQAVIPLTTADQGIAGYRILLPDENARFQVSRLSRLNSSETSFLVDVGSDMEKGYHWINQANIQFIDKQTQPIILSTPESYDQEIQATFLQGAYTLQLSDQGGELRGERQTKYPLQIAKSWDDASWMGIVLNAEGYPAGPAFILNEIPNRVKEADDTVFPRDIEITFDTDGNETAVPNENKGTLILFPPGRLEGMKLAEQEYLLKSGKHYWLRMYLEKNNRPRFEIFYQENGGSVFESDERQCGLVFTPAGDVLGVAVPSSIIQKTGNLDLQPASYFPRLVQASEAGSDSPAEVLKNIHMAQLDLAGQIRKLLTLAEMKPAANESIPPHQVKISPIGRLEGIQKAIWDVIQTKIELTRQGTTPLPFQLEDLELPYTLPEIQLTIDLFERMGLLVKVSIKDAHYYRLISTRETDKGKKP